MQTSSAEVGDWLSCNFKDCKERSVYSFAGQYMSCKEETKIKIYYFTFRSRCVLLYLISHSTSGSQIKLVKTGCCEVAV